jgi:hypothetical protein
MSQNEKARYYQALKAAGVNFDKHYREYNTEGLRAAWLKLNDDVDLDEPPEPTQLDQEEPPPPTFFGFEAPEPEPVPTQDIEVRHADPDEMAGQRQNSQPADVPIRIDPETGREWYQEEVLKPAYPKPRGRRVLTYLETGTKQVQTKSGEFVETFEVAGDGPPRTAEVKITLPSYQVGVFKDPRFPFKVHTYNGLEGFDLFEVRDYYGGAELVPAEVKLVYVENVLCYDIRSVVRAIEAEYRQLMLTGKVPE